jgi:hypothetical protein
MKINFPLIFKLTIVFVYMATSGYSQAPVKNNIPFERDMKTGYLINYFFMSPKPYCWEKEAIYLSGWEVDKSGGTFSFSPSGKYPESFAFNIDWFRLEDTSETKSINISHQIARQTEGFITLEFRFRLPKKMDHACWQLKDLKDAGVSITTLDNILYVESKSGKKIPLQSIEPDKEYGVQAHVDLSNQKADYYVDGHLKAKNVPFLHPIKTVDYFSTQTGDAATGQMYLNPVNIFKGYAVNETFVTCNKGVLPSHWERDKGTASVEEFECGTKPDIFSLYLQPDANSKATHVMREFTSLEGKVVWESRFLVPGENCEASLELVSKQNFGVKIGITKDNIVFYEADGKTVILVSGFRTNLWYMLKLIANQEAGTADIYINGKLIAEKVHYSNNGLRFEKLQFSSDSPLWIDDVELYSWSDYPANYVPEPQAIASKDDYVLGVQSCNLWKEGRAYAGWEYVYPFSNNRKPYLGWYDEGNPEVVDWEIKWQVEHGIGFELHCWYRPNNAVNNPIKDGVLDENITKGLFSARYSYKTKFAIMCTDEGACITNFKDFQGNIIPYWIEYFFKDPRYMKIEGKPLLSIYSKDNWVKMFGGEEEGRRAILILREEVKKAGFPGIVIFMEDRNADVSSLQAKKSLGVDAIYSYTWFTDDAKVEKERMIAQRDTALSVGLPVIPAISMGWDREAWGVHDGGFIPVNDYKELAEWTKDIFMPSLPANSLGLKMLLLANWNEFGEGHFLMPSSLAGFGYIDALREVFTNDSKHVDVAPTDLQKKRFTVLYPKD